MITTLTENDWLGIAGKVFAVTGAASGMGAAIARQLAESGAIVGLLDKDVQAVSNAAAQLQAQGFKALGLACDVSSKAEVDKAADRLGAELGPVHGLVNNAGFLQPSLLRDIALEDWNALMAVNLNGYLLCAQAFGRQMQASHGGVMVHVASIAGVFPQANSGAYSASKSAIIQLSRQIAVEWGPEIRSNCVCPGMIKTALSARFYEQPGAEEKRAAVTASRRIGVPDDIANVVLFLLSDRSSYVNGSEVMVTGGMDAMLLNMVPRAGFNAS